MQALFENCARKQRLARITQQVLLNSCLAGRDCHMTWKGMRKNAWEDTSDWPTSKSSSCTGSPLRVWMITNSKMIIWNPLKCLYHSGNNYYMQSVSSQKLISDYSYSRGGGAELFPITVAAAVAARNYFPIPVTVAVRKDRK